MLSKKVRGGDVAYKVDIHKGFDSLSWKFLLLVLTHFGFHPSHILYVDDIFVFYRGDIKSLRNLSIFLKTYGDFSNQYVNNTKSSFSTIDNSARFVTKIQRIISCSHVCLSFNYLGVSIFVGAPKCRFFQPLTDKVKLKQASWKGKSLSMMGRIQLVNMVIIGFLAYSFNMYKWPISLLKAVISKLYLYW